MKRCTRPELMTRNDSAADRTKVENVSTAELQRFHVWLYERTLPFWQLHGTDREAGGFHEQLDLDCRPNSSSGKRLVVQARQIYVYARASHAGLLDGALECARHGFEFLLAHYLTENGWRHSVHRDGTSLDNRRDLYDQAFAIFALAWWFRASGEEKALDLAERTLDFLERTLADYANGGFGEGLDADGQVLQQPRRQNPHMHLLEALMALHDATGEVAYLKRAEALVTLAKDRFVVDGSLREYFAADLKPLPSAAGRVVEPGHHFEWVWLLYRYAELAGPGSDVTALADQLYRFAVDHGSQPRTGGVIDEIDCAGKPTKASRRVWPQTEALKAHAARAALAGDFEAGTRLNAMLATLRRDHLAAPAVGAWREHLDLNGKSIMNSMPASTLYHLAFACSEIERLTKSGDT